MIRLFLKGLPYTLSQPMYREFEAKKRELISWFDHSKNKKIKKCQKRQEVIEYIFSIGIYYRYVIAPLTQTGALFSRLKKNDISSMLVGGTEIGPDFQKSISKAEKHFNMVIEKYSLTKSFFSITDVKQIVFALIKIHEQLD